MAAMRTLRIVWPTSVQVASKGHMAKQTLTRVAANRTTTVRLDRAMKFITIAANRVPKKMPNTGKPESIMSLERKTIRRQNT